MCSVEEKHCEIYLHKTKQGTYHNLYFKGSHFEPRINRSAMRLAIHRNMVHFNGATVTALKIESENRTRVNTGQKSFYHILLVLIIKSDCLNGC